MTDPSTDPPRPHGVNPEDANKLVGQQVVVTAAHQISGWVSEHETFTGRLIAVGRKFGHSRNTRPYCLVLDCTDSKRGVPIIAVRAVVKIEPVPGGPHSLTLRHLDLAPDHTPDSTSGETA